MKPIFLLVLGAPGVGKGTYARLLRKDLGFNHVAPDHEMSKILQGTIPPHFDKDLVRLIRETVKESTIDTASTDIYLRLIEEKCKEKESGRGVVLDGYPDSREELRLFLERMQVHMVLHVTQREDVLVEKMLGRRLCSNCGYGYNIADIQRYPCSHSGTATPSPPCCLRLRTSATTAGTS